MSEERFVMGEWEDRFERELAKPLDVPGTMEPGIYFGLDEDTYHQAPALSNSGVKHMLISPLDFWARSWMNPEREVFESGAMALGKAWHKRLLEGHDAFYAGYAADIDPGDHPDALRSSDEIKARLKELELKVSGRKADIIVRLQDADPMVEIWDVLAAEHRTANDGRVLLPCDIINKIELQAAMIEKHPDLKRMFNDGYPEVSIFWFDPDTGVPCKARLDYLKQRAVIDLKTFSNPLGKPIDRAIATAMASGKYHIQVAKYLHAVDQAAQLVRDDKVFGEVDHKWLDAMAAVKPEDRHFAFVFQQTGIAPVARAYDFPRQLNMFDIGKITVRMATQLFADNWATYGTDPWIDTTPIGTFADEDFPIYMAEA